MLAKSKVQVINTIMDKMAGLFPARIVRVVHIYSSMFMLLIMLFFTLTGITLNHQNWFGASAESQLIERLIPDDLVQRVQPFLEAEQDANSGSASNPSSSNPVSEIAIALPLIEWLRSEYQVQGQEIRLDWDSEEQLFVVDIQQPGGYSIAEFDLAAGELVLELKYSGLIAQLNDLHKGRHTGALWRGFIDASAAVLLLFTLSGFWLLLPQKKRRTRAIGVGGLGAAMFLFLYWQTL